jgi:glycosyltransferase involved in cell wall biosynthesis
MENRKFALYQPVSGGHRGEYIDHVLSTIGEVRPTDDIYVLTSEGVRDRLEQYQGPDFPAACLETLTKTERERIEEAPTLLQKSLRQWRPLYDFARRHEIDHCVLLRFNQLQFALGLYAVSDLPFTVSGIFPHPFVREEVSGESPVGWLKAYLAHQRRRFSLRWAMRNPFITNVFLLNDPTAASTLNETLDPERERFSAIPDPVFSKAEQGELPSEGVRSRYVIDENRHLFLLSGVLSRRKGVLNAVRATMSLNRDAQQQMALLVTGKPSSEIRSELEKAIDELKTNHAVQVRADFRFLSDPEFEQAFRESDVVLTLYLRSKGSSGILGHAARNRTPVLGPRDGLVGELIKQYGLGERVVAADVSDVATGIRMHLQERAAHSTEGMKRYVQERTISAFTSTLLSR